MMLSMMGYVINDLLIKSLDGSIGNAQIMWLRGTILTILVGVIIWQRGLIPRLPEAITGLVAFRSLLEAIATLFFLAAITRLPFANISAILQSLPLAITLGAALVLGESVGWRRWLAIGIGFIGVLIIVRPGMQGFDSASVLVVITVIVAAIRDLATRRLPASTPSLLVSGVAALVIALIGMALTLLQDTWQPVSLQQWAVLSLAAVFLFVGYQFIVLGMRTGDVAYVMPFRYTSLLWAIGLAYVMFDEVPDAATLIGSAIIVIMGLFTLYREIVLGRQQLRATEDVISHVVENEGKV